MEGSSKLTEETKIQETKLSEISIIFGKPDHADILAEFNYKMGVETEDKHIDTALVSKAIHKLLSSQDESGDQRALGFYLVAVNLELTPIGCMMLTLEANPTVGGLVYMIQSVFVEKEYRKQGVFRKLFERAKQLGEQDPECRCLRLYVETENEVAQKVYQNMGMGEVDYSFMEKDFVFKH